MHVGTEQRLIGVDVADTSNVALVEQERLDRAHATARHGRQPLACELVIERLQPESRIEKLLERVRAEQQLARAEAPWIDDHQPSFRLQVDPHARMDRLRLRFEQHCACHAQVLSEVHVVAEVPQQVLATPAERFDATTLERF
jgi:hypothetical protein